MTDTPDQAAKQQTEAAKKHAEDAKKKLADERAARDKASKEHSKMIEAVKPTPTQEENDLAAMGVHVVEKEDDGSGPDPNVPQDKDAPHTKQAEAAKPKPGYQTK